MMQSGFEQTFTACSIQVHSAADNAVTVTHTTTTHDGAAASDSGVTQTQVTGVTVARNLVKIPVGSEIPDDFNYAAYLKWNPHLVAAGISTLQDALAHYRGSGWKERLIYKEFNVTLRCATSSAFVLPGTSVRSAWKLFICILQYILSGSRHPNILAFILKTTSRVTS